LSNVTVSTWKKSIPSRLPAWQRREARQDSPRRPGGGNAVRPEDAADGRRGDAASEPAQLTLDAHHTAGAVLAGQPQNQRDTSSLIGGRPVGEGWVHFLATSRWCRRIRVPGVTIRRPRSVFGSSLASAASTARSGQRKHGFQFPRRNTATSWRNASNSASFDADERRQRQPGQDDSEQAIDHTDRHDYRSSQVTSGG
jgi:hypothetical protein